MRPSLHTAFSLPLSGRRLHVEWIELGGSAGSASVAGTGGGQCTEACPPIDCVPVAGKKFSW